MAQTGYTPISIYYSATATNTPTAGNLVAGELAINTNDGVLYYKDSSGVVQSIASKAGNSGSFTNLAYTGTLTGGTGVVNLGSGQFYKDASGNVGIGTASPAKILDIVGTTPIINIQGGATTNARGINFSYNSSSSVIGSLISYGATGELALSAGNSGSAGYFITMSTYGSERMRITSGGAVLIGTTSATNTFVVSSASGGTAVAQIINTSSSGNVISVASTLQSNGNNTSSAHYQGNTTGVGNWYLFGNGTSSYSSDERLKKNIETTRSGYLEDLCKLRVVKYNWRLDEEGKNKELGLIAQEVEQVFPNLVQDDLNPVSQDDDTIYKQLKQSVLPFMLLKAIQELNAKVTALEAKLGA